jgi:hypothetical protein
VLFNQGLMPAGPPASEPQMADAESLHKVGCCSDAGSCNLRGMCLVIWGAWVFGQAEWHPLLFNQGLMPAGPPASEPQMADAESLHKVSDAAALCW